MNPTTSRARLSLAGLACVVALATQLPAQAGDDTIYVALGDSFSAGTGTRAPTDGCYRSPYGYPVLIAASRGLDLDYQACSGATTADVTSSQLGTLRLDTDYVTMTIGGNDLDFTGVIIECALPGWLSNCQGKINTARTTLYGVLPGRYDALLDTIGTKAPNAAVTVGGYPRLFNGHDCSWLTFFSRSEMRSLNGATDDLDAVIAGRTAAAGHTYVDPRAAFTGHAMCDNVEFINGLSWPIVESFHPNRLGNRAYANVFWPGSAAPAAASSVTAPSGVNGTSVRQRAQLVLDMHLTSPANLAAARRAGVPTGELRKLTADLRSSDPKVVEGALVQLHRLDRQHEARMAATG